MSMDISTEDEQLARRAISLFDLMALDVDDTESRIVGLCHRAMTPLGPIAAICVYPRFVLLARTTTDRLQHRDIRVVAVVNFPYGSANEEAVMSETRAAVMSGPTRSTLCTRSALCCQAISRPGQIWLLHVVQRAGRTWCSQ